MDTLKISGTDESPEIILDKITSEMVFSGKSLPEDVKEFYKPVISWLEKYTENPNDITKVEFKLEYFNSASSKQILDILTRFERIHKKGKKVEISWCYQSDDEDMEDAGLAFAGILEVPIKLVHY